jgi:outer membrane murein-binding lipoprotein Lpp
MTILMILTHVTGAASVDVKYRKQSDQVRELQFKIDRLEKELGGSKE